MPSKLEVIEQAKMQAKPFDRVLEKVMDICPSCVQNGKIDFERLRLELAEHVDDDTKEFYDFTWTGKKQAIVNANSSVNKTLRPCREESVNFDTTQNLYIEGDNLEVLKLLHESYLNKVKMIYIDPPYNTGNDFVYNDTFKQSLEEYEEELGSFDDEGNRLFRNTETNGRFHSDWCSMIYPRLKIARNLLTEDGVIFISIDDNEVHNLRKICDEIFGEDNFVAKFAWICATAGGIRPKFVSKTHEHILLYAKNIAFVPRLDAPLSPEAIKQYNKEDDKGRYREKDFVFKNSSTNANQYYPIECPDGEKVIPKRGYIYRFIRETFDKALEDDMVVFKKTNSGPLLNENGEQASWNIYIKKYLGEGTGCPSSVLPRELIGMYNSGTQCVQGLFDSWRVFENGKPFDLISYLSKIVTKSDDIILDFFSGSGTTAHAVMQLNAQDGGSRKFICVQLPEETDEKSEAYKAGYKNICEIGKERIRRAGAKIKEEMLAKNAKNTTESEANKSLANEAKTTLFASEDFVAKPKIYPNLDYGFRVLKVDSSNMKDVFYEVSHIAQKNLLDNIENIKEDRTSLDLLYGIMLDWGVMLDLAIEEKKVGSNTYYIVGDKDLVACFDNSIERETLEAMANEMPIRAVFRDSSFNNKDDAKINMRETFKIICSWSEKDARSRIRVI